METALHIALLAIHPHFVLDFKVSLFHSPKISFLLPILLLLTIFR